MNQVGARRWVSFRKAAGLIRNLIIEGSHEAAVLDKVAELCRGVGHDPAAHAFVLWNWVRTHVYYLDDPRNDDHFQTPEVTMKRLAGDCDDQTILLGSLLRAVGFQVRLVFLFSQPPKDYSVEFPEHVYLEFNADKTGNSPLWTCADTVPRPDGYGDQQYARFGQEVNVGFAEYIEVDQ